MRTIEEFRERILADLPHALKRPQMFGGNAFGAELYFRHVLHDLCFIDEREPEMTVLRQKYLHGPLGVRGQFAYQDVFDSDFINEATSTFAQVAFILGYFTPSRLLSRSEWIELNDAINAEFLSRDWTHSDIQERFGPPSLDLGGGDTAVACYACEDRESNWLYFDFYRKFPSDPSCNWFESPRLRDLRARDNQFVLVPFGRSLAKQPSPLET